MAGDCCSICGTWGQKTRECCGNNTDYNGYTPPWPTSDLKDVPIEKLQEELKRRKIAAQTEETRQARIKEHNEPILKEITRLERELTNLKSRLKS